VKRLPAAVEPMAHQVATETAVPKEMPHLVGKPNSDFMVEASSSRSNIDYVYSNPASSFRGLHESLINYGKNSKPEFITCMHEESSVAMAHGYFKATGKPQLMLCHGTVGLMHATMAVYNAWADRVPLINDRRQRSRCRQAPAGRADLSLGAGHRRAGARLHQVGRHAGVGASTFAQSFVRAYRYAMTPPYGPVLLSLDAGLQDAPVTMGISISRGTSPRRRPHADLNALREAATLLVAAENPVIVVDKMARTRGGREVARAARRAAAGPGRPTSWAA